MAGEQGEMTGTGRGVEILGNFEVTLAGDSGGGLVRAGPNGRGRTDVAST